MSACLRCAFYFKSLHLERARVWPLGRNVHLCLICLSYLSLMSWREVEMGGRSHPEVGRHNQSGFLILDAPGEAGSGGGVTLGQRLADDHDLLNGTVKSHDQ